MVIRMALMPFHKALLRGPSTVATPPHMRLLRRDNANSYGYFLRKDVAPVAVAALEFGLTAALLYAAKTQIESLTGKKR